MHCSKKALEGEMHKLRGHYTQMNDERIILKSAVDDYMRDFANERAAREDSVREMMKLKTTIKDKDDKINSLQDQLASYGGSKLKPVSDLLLHC